MQPGAGKQSGAIAEAVRRQRVVPAQAADFETLYGLAIAQMRSGALEQALQNVRTALKLKFDSPDGWCVQARLQMHLRQPEEALRSFNSALSLQPDLTEALAGRASVLCQMDRAAESLVTYDRLLALCPNDADAWNNRGSALIALARYEDAVASFDKALLIDPKLDSAIRNRDSAVLERDGKAIRTLYYRAHAHLRTLADRVLPASSAGLRILDLGSGTGLAGDVFKDLCVKGRLDGVDLSPRMIEAAARRGIYDQLILGDIETVLQTFDRSYDLILAADTMIFCGDLVAMLAGAFKRLRPGGFYLFAVERWESAAGWEQTQNPRFRHSESYLQAAASQAGFVFARSMACVLRRAGDHPVQGLTVALRKP